MRTPDIVPLWWTASRHGVTVDTSPMELSALGEHLATCHDARGHLFALHGAAERMHGFMATRFVTTVVALTLLFSVSRWIH